MANLKLEKDLSAFDNMELYKYSKENVSSIIHYDFNICDFNFQNLYSGFTISDKSRNFSQDEWNKFFKDLAIFSQSIEPIHKEKLNLFKYYSYTNYRFPKPHIEHIQGKANIHAIELANNSNFLSICENWKNIKPEEKPKQTIKLANTIVSTITNKKDKVKIEAFCSKNNIAGSTKIGNFWDLCKYKLKINIHPTFLEENSLGEILDTIYHELTHINQLKIGKKPLSKIDEILSINKQSSMYISYKDFYTGYLYQPVEQEAFIAGISFTKALEENISFKSGIQNKNISRKSPINTRSIVQKIVHTIQNINTL